MRVPKIHGWAGFLAVVVLVAAGIGVSGVWGPKQDPADAGVGSGLRPAGLGWRTRLTGDEVHRFLGRNSVGVRAMGVPLSGTAPVNFRQWEVQARLLAGQKLVALQTTNASLLDLMVGWCQYANRNVQLLMEVEGTERRLLGPFDSAKYLTRWRAARAIEKQLQDADWHLLTTADGVSLLVSGTDLKSLESAPPQVRPPPIPGR